MDLQKVLDQFSKSKLGKSSTSKLNLYLKCRTIYEYNHKGEIIKKFTYSDLRNIGICLDITREHTVTEDNRVFSYSSSIPNFSNWLEKRLTQLGRGSKIYKFSPDGQLVKVYDNLAQAEKDGYIRTNIRRSLGKYDTEGKPRKHGGFVWKRENNFCSVK